MPWVTAGVVAGMLPGVFAGTGGSFGSGGHGKMPQIGITIGPCGLPGVMIVGVQGELKNLYEHRLSK